VVADGDALLAPSVTRRLIADVVSRAPSPETPRGLGELTPREREILGLVGGALSNDEIADRLTISKATAKTHVSRIMGKLDARDRAQLVVVAYESGLVTPNRGSR
jgi:DNA-binding NarL/FixJ family response regulator